MQRLQRPSRAGGASPPRAKVLRQNRQEGASMLSPLPLSQTRQRRVRSIRIVLGVLMSVSLLIGSEAKAVVAESPNGNHVALLGKINFAALANGGATKPPLPDAGSLAGNG